MPWLEDLKFPRGYQMGTHKNKNVLKFLDYSILCLVEGDKNANEKAN